MKRLTRLSATNCESYCLRVLDWEAPYNNKLEASKLRSRLVYTFLDVVFSSTPNVRNVRSFPPLAACDHAIVKFENSTNSERSRKALALKFESVIVTSISSSKSPRKAVWSKRQGNWNCRITDWLKLFDRYSSVNDVHQRFCLALYSVLCFYSFI